MAKVWSAWVAAAAVVALGNVQRPQNGILSRVDHLVYATPDLNVGIERIEKLTGIRAAPGGQHPGRGTRNALVSLGAATYLEIIGPDPAQPVPQQGRPFLIDTLTEPRLVTWAAKSSDLDRVAAGAARGGTRLGEVIPGSRKRPDGVVLSWRYTDPRMLVADGVAPFFIDWGRSPHPAQSATLGASLRALRAEHPHPDDVRKVLDTLGVGLELQSGPKPALVATIDTPKGRIDLR